MLRPAILEPFAPSKNTALFQSSIATKSRPRPARNIPLPPTLSGGTSLVQMIVNVIEPDHGTVLDPACGSGGMFVQSAHFIEGLHKRPSDQATFYGMEKNPTTIRLAKMNLAVHGLEGNIDKAITYYEDTHELVVVVPSTHIRC